mmetsp:Transcript_15719/g.49472  ORF Transcript_15719/g.49472 Transcript_15719/m.49472 type:complete len:197 (-) Transcript_15719:41-631(-)
MSKVMWSDVVDRDELDHDFQSLGVSHAIVAGVVLGYSASLFQYPYRAENNGLCDDGCDKCTNIWGTCDASKKAADVLQAVSFINVSFLLLAVVVSKMVSRQMTVLPQRVVHHYVMKARWLQAANYNIMIVGFVCTFFGLVLKASLCMEVGAFVPGLVFAMLSFIGFMSIRCYFEHVVRDILREAKKEVEVRGEEEA